MAEAATFAGYGAAGDDKLGGASKSLFLRFNRRRLNLLSIIGAFVWPSALFAGILAIQCFDLSYRQPTLAILLEALGFLLVVIVAGIAINHRSQSFMNPETEPSWYIFLAVTMLIAWVLAMVVGNSIYLAVSLQFYEILDLNSYSDVDPNTMRGQQLMDAGAVAFASGTSLDLAMSMGFKSNSMYCVAPIVSNSSAAPATYDFWAVGKDCCTSGQADFACSGYNDPRANGGLRMMNDKDRAYYRLAVQQAEATYQITAAHPLFFEWVADPMSMVSGWETSSHKQYLVWVLTFVTVQAFLVASAAITFSKIGSSD